MPDDTPDDPRQIIADLQREVARYKAEREEALARETAIAEVLQVINSSPGDLAPVFDAMLEKAMRLCDAAFGGLTSYDGERFRAVATRGLSPALAEIFREPWEAAPGSFHYRLIRGASFVHADLAALNELPSGHLQSSGVVELGGARTGLVVPLRKDDTLTGSLLFYRQDERPFTARQIALVENFAAQAVIAMENARLITETREALDQQTATAEVLRVINSSPGDLAPVFDAMLEKAMRLCGAEFGTLATFDGTRFHTAATRGVPAAFAEYRKSNPPPYGRGTIVARILGGEPLIHTVDLRAEEIYRSGDPNRRALVDLGGARTSLVVPLIKHPGVLGVIQIYRQDVRPFTDKQIALLQNFAAQAVIAIENARLITETREALEQQTATAEVLGVINSSPGDLTPVFDAMLEKAMRLCDAAFGGLTSYDGERFCTMATGGLSRELAEIFREPFVPSPGSFHERLAHGEPLVHGDHLDNPSLQSGSPQTRGVVELGGARTGLVTGLRKEDRLLGSFWFYRRELRPFTDKQIALLQNFAEQAVIAMENARLITETREALDQQTATAEVLGVINSSPGDLAPVFDAILEKAHTLLGASYGLLGTYDGKQFRAVATHGLAGPIDGLVREPFRPPPGSPHERLVDGEPVVHIADLAIETLWTQDDPKRLATLKMGIRTLLFVPLRKDDLLLGYISADRLEVKPFTEKEIALLQNFASQAVIAMENARLLTETREALEQQTATAEVLGVINSSPGNLVPVFDAVLEKAMRLCGADFGIFFTYDGEQIQAPALRGASPAYAEFLVNNPLRPTPNNMHGRLIAGETFVQIADATLVPGFALGDPMVRAFVELADGRTVMAVSLRKDGVFLGEIAVYRREVRPFTDKQIVLLQNFAAQAVIAMENARLLGEIQQRQAELRVTFDNMADGVVMFDEELRLAAWNRNFQELLDLPDAVLAERPSYADYLRTLAERGEFGTEDIEAELGRRLEQTDQELRLERTRPDGRVIEVRRNAVPDGGFVLIYSDITERKRSEVEIRTARDAAEAALRDLKAAQANLIQAEKMASLGQLTAGIAHEIKNPLNFVNNFASLSVELLEELKETTAPAVAALDEEKRAEADDTMELLTGNLEKIAEHGKRADNIVKSMLEHSRGVTGERREVDLNGLIDEALNLAYHGARAQDQSFKITLERDFDQALPAVELAPQEITRVFLNLFGNGFYAANKRAREDGDGSFRPALTVATRGVGDAVEVTVRDNGTGIPPEIKNKLFQPFFTTKPTGEGTGLGLSISYDIVTQQHGGRITVESEPGSFTEFTVRLPRHH